MMKEKKYKTLIGIMVLVIGPIGVYFLSRCDFFTQEGNDWIGFLGSYIGAIVGACVAIYVLMETLKSEKESEVKKEKVAFCNYITEKASLFAQKYEATIYSAHMHMVTCKGNDNDAKLDTYLKFIELHHSSKALLYEIESYLTIRREFEEFYSERLEELLKIIDLAYDLWGKYETELGRNVNAEDSSVKQEGEVMLVDVIEKLLAGLREYGKELIGGKKGKKMKSLKEIYKEGKKHKGDKETLVNLYLEILKSEIRGDKSRLIIYKHECSKKVDFALPMFLMATIAILITGASIIINILTGVYESQEQLLSLLIIEVGALIAIPSIYYYAVLANNKKFSLFMTILQQEEQALLNKSVTEDKE